MHQILLVLQYIADNLFKYSVFSGKGIVSAITDRCLIISSSSSSSHSRLPLPLKQEGPFSSRNATVKRIVTSCSLSLRFSSHVSRCTVSTGCRARIIHQVRTNEWVWNIFPYLSGWTADPQPLQPSLLFSLLSWVLEGFLAAFALEP